MDYNFFDAEHTNGGMLGKQKSDLALESSYAAKSFAASRKSDSKNGHCCDKRDCVCGYSFFFWE
jgi:hypothetical protein